MTAKRAVHFSYVEGGRPLCTLPRPESTIVPGDVTCKTCSDRLYYVTLPFDIARAADEGSALAAEALHNLDRFWRAQPLSAPALFRDGVIAYAEKRVDAARKSLAYEERGLERIGRALKGGS